VLDADPFRLALTAARLSSPQISCRASSPNSDAMNAAPQWIFPTHALEPQPRPSSEYTSMMVRTPASRPPNFRGAVSV